MQHGTFSLGVSDLEPRFVILGKVADDMVDELLPLAHGTATHGHGITLDGTSLTINNLEAILSTASEEIRSAGLTPDDERVKTFMMIFSIYLGEVFRREHQGEWMEAHYDQLGTSTLCVCSRTSRVVFIEPFTRIKRRIFDGPDYDVANYYRSASKLANAT